LLEVAAREPSLDPLLALPQQVERAMQLVGIDTLHLQLLGQGRLAERAGAGELRAGRLGRPLSLTKIRE
jgi:hypothetical protein